MSARSYSFLDVAVLEAVRGRLAAGDALVVLSLRLDAVLWANGPGAALLGHDDIFSLIGTDPALPVAAQRQIAAAPGFPDVPERALALRLGGQIHAFTASTLTMPDAERAILLAASDPVAAARPREDIARRAIAGLSGEGQFVALVNAAGVPTAASPGFDGLGLAAETLRQLAAEVAGERDRLVKRLVPAARATLPAGIARLTDEPALNLLMVVDEQALEAAEGTGAVDAADGPGLAPPAPAAAEPAGAEPSDAAGAAPPQTPGTSAQSASAGPAAGAPHVRATPDGGAARPAPASGAHDEDGWYFNGDSRVARTPRDEAAPTPVGGRHGPAAGTELLAMPLRFVWRTDAAGRFSAISDEFRVAFGERAADILGQPFDDVARRLGLDPDGEIAGLLARRDTWSGRSVLWPVAGTDLRVPVDLAALPVYGRDRAFEGFRGFGVARMGDAMIDPEATGLALAGVEDRTLPDPDAPPPAARQPAPETPDGDEPGTSRETPGQGAPQDGQTEDAGTADPFRGEPPALLTDLPAPAGSEKVIRLEERRPGNAARGLSTAERLNFREIGEKLRNAGLKPADEAGPFAPAVPETEPPAGKAPAPGEPAHLDADRSGQAGDIEPTEAATPEAAPAGDGDGAQQQARDGLSGASGTDAGSEDAGATQDEPDATAAPAAQPPAGSDAVPAASEAGEDTASVPAAATETRAEAAGQPPQASPAAMAASAPPPTAEQPSGGRAHPVSGFLPSAFAGVAGDPTASGVDTSLLARLPLPLLVHAGDTLFYANREFLQITGYPSLAELNEAGGLGAIFGEPYASDDDGPRKLRLRTRAGAEFPVDAFLQSVGWDGGKALLLALRRVEEPAAQAAAGAPEEADADARLEELRTIIDTATDGVVIIGNDGKIRSISRPAEALFGVDGFNLVGQPFASLFAMESQKAAADYLAGLAENGVASVLNDGREVIGREAQGRFIPLFMTMGRLPRQSGFCAVLRDITNWKRAEENLTEARTQAELASSHKTEFLARVSHEIRTPLNAIIGFSELMLDEKFGPIGNDRYKDYLRDINKSGNHVLDLVNDLLDISKIEAGQQEMSYEAVSLNETLAEVVAMMQPQANRERVIIRSSFASRLPEVVADLRSVRQIALNLLSNAIRYTPAGGQVIVSTAYEAAGDIVMRVRDTGIGMAPAEIEQALKPFRQVNALKRPRGDGTGLGLPLTKAMVEANRARFAINSVPGEGTLVEITFPSTRVLAH